MYPIIINCYEQTHPLVQAARDNNCPDALQALEAVLEEELDDNGEFERGMLSEQAIDEAEAAVYAALDRDMCPKCDTEKAADGFCQCVAWEHDNIGDHTDTDVCKYARCQYA